MLTIRLSRIGKRNKPMYRLVISEKAKDPYGKALEILGSYDPYIKKLQAKADRIKYWLSKGAQMSASVNNILVDQGLIKAEKAKTFKVNTKKQLKKREEEKAKEQEKQKVEKAEKEKEEADKQKEQAEAPKEAEAQEQAEENKKETESEAVNGEASESQSEEEKKDKE